MNIFVRSLFGTIEHINTYNLYSIKEVKIMHDLLYRPWPYNMQSYVYNGKGLENDRVLSYYNIKDNGTIHMVIRFKNRILKNYFDIYYSQNKFALIKNQNINGLWEANEYNIKLLNKFDDYFSNFYNTSKDLYLKFLNQKEYNENISFTIFVISYLNSFPTKKRYKYIIEKAINFLKKETNGDYNEEKQREFDIFIINI